MKHALFFACAGIASTLAFAQLANPLGPAGGAPSHSNPAFPGQAMALPDVKGAVSWDLLAKVKPVRSKERILPEFDKAVLELNKRDVKLAGFMMPLSPGEKQTHFLVTVTPQTCNFCLPAGPEGMVEVKTKTPFKVTFEPIVLAGKFEVLPNDPAGLYYRLNDAQPSK
jgi:uncharacterized protein